MRRAVWMTGCILILLSGAAWFALRPSVYPAPQQRAEGSRSEVIFENTYKDPHPFMEGLYAVRDAAHTTGTVRAVIVPHHLTASASMAAGIAALRGQSFKQILLISPDHFSACATALCTVNARYKTIFGDVTSSPAIVEALLRSPLVSRNPSLFEREHGIFAVLPFIAHDVPGIPVTPLVIGNRWKPDRAQIRNLLAEILNDETVLIVSSDFSHYLSLEEADAMDTRTITALHEQHPDHLLELHNPDQSDCPGCLWTLASLARQQHFYRPEILMHTNSALLLNNPALPETTSHFSIIWKKEMP